MASQSDGQSRPVPDPSGPDPAAAEGTAAATSQGVRWPDPPTTIELNQGPLDGLSKRERRRMRRAVMRGRPLPPRLARAAVEYAPTLHRLAWAGYLMLTMGALYVAGATLDLVKHGSPWWDWLSHEVLGVLWLTMGGWWFWATRRAGRAAREGYWPERAEEDR